MRGTNGPPEQWLEHQESQRRITHARRWATRRVGELLAAQQLGADESDPDFARRMEELFAGLRTRLTRQDLLWAFMDGVGKAAAEHAERIRASHDAEVDALIGESTSVDL